MSFVRKKVIGGRVYKYEVENVREANGSVVQRVLRYLGPEQPIYGTENERRAARRRRE